MPPNLTRDDSLFLQSADVYASRLADANRVETAWWLRGLVARLVGAEADIEQAEDPLYGRYYRDGWNEAGRAP